MDQKGRTLNIPEVTDDREQDDREDQREQRGTCTQGFSFLDSNSAISKPMPFYLGREGRLFFNFRGVLEKN